MTKRTFVPLLALACMMTASAAITANVPEQKQSAVKIDSAPVTGSTLKNGDTKIQPVMYRSERDKLVFKNPLLHPENDKIRIIRPVYRPGIDTMKISDLADQNNAIVKP